MDVGVSGSWDEQIMRAVAEHRTTGATSLANLMMDVGTSPLLLAIAAMVVLLVALWRRRYRPVLAAAMAFVAAVVAVGLLKPVFDRPRPPARLALVWLDTPSFPSTHATTTSAVAVSLLLTMAWGTRRRAVLGALVLLALVVFVGVCMVYLGAHWPTDVLAGWLLGVAIGGVVGQLARRRPQPPVVRRERVDVEHAR